MSSKLRIAFFGSDPIALPMLEYLATQRSSVEIAGIWTQPDRRRGRGMKQVSNEIKQWAEWRSIAVRQPSKIGEADYQWAVNEALDLVLVMAYGHILKQRLIETPRLGTLNLHASLLPKYRGASPIETAIAEGESETGVSLMQIVPKMDAGPVMDAEHVPISREETGLSLRKRLAEACVPLIKRALPKLAASEARFAEQHHELATYCRRLNKDDAMLDFNAPAGVLVNRIRAFYPWPGAVCLHGDTSLKIGSAVAVSTQTADHQKPPGTILSATASGVEVAAAEDSAVIFQQLQRPGAKMLPAADFLRGYPIGKGEVLAGGKLTQLVQKR